jgi:hypothetical protein
MKAIDLEILTPDIARTSQKKSLNRLAAADGVALDGDTRTGTLIGAEGALSIQKVNSCTHFRPAG